MTGAAPGDDPGPPAAAPTDALLHPAPDPHRVLISPKAKPADGLRGRQVAHGQSLDVRRAQYQSLAGVQRRKLRLRGSHAVTEWQHLRVALLEHQRTRRAGHLREQRRRLNAQNLRPCPAAAVHSDGVASGEYQRRVHRRRVDVPARVPRLRPFLPPRVVVHVVKTPAVDVGGAEHSSSILRAVLVKKFGSSDRRRRRRRARAGGVVRLPRGGQLDKRDDTRATRDDLGTPSLLVTPVHRGHQRLHARRGIFVFVFDDLKRIASAVDLREPPPGARVVVRREVIVRAGLVEDVSCVVAARERGESAAGVDVVGDAV